MKWLEFKKRKLTSQTELQVTVFFFFLTCLASSNNSNSFTVQYSPPNVTTKCRFHPRRRWNVAGNERPDSSRHVRLTTWIIPCEGKTRPSQTSITGGNQPADHRGAHRWPDYRRRHTAAQAPNASGSPSTIPAARSKLRHCACAKIGGARVSGGLEGLLYSLRMAQWARRGFRDVCPHSIKICS